MNDIDNKNRSELMTTIDNKRYRSKTKSIDNINTNIDIQNSTIINRTKRKTSLINSEIIHETTKKIDLVKSTEIERRDQYEFIFV